MASCRANWDAARALGQPVPICFAPDGKGGAIDLDESCCTIEYVGSNSNGSIYGCHTIAYCTPPPNTGYDTTYPYLFCPAGEPEFLGLCGGPNPNLVKGYCPWCEGNPINALVGNKTQFEHDYAGQGAFPLVFDRTYNSWGAAPGALMGTYGEFYASSTPSPNQEYGQTPYTPVNGPTGTPTAPTIVGVSSNSMMDPSWRHNYDRTLTFISMASGTFAELFRGDSKARTFKLSLGNNTWVADPGQLSTKLTETTDGNGNPVSWSYVNENDETELYDSTGTLQSITNRAGLTQTLQYNGGALSSVTDPYGHQLQFTYGNGGLASMTDPNGGTYTYNYDGYGNLSTVTYPDGGVRQYLYENANFPTALTGIIDENGNRYATWSYDLYGNATSSEHAGGVEAVTMNFPSATTTSATDAGGATRTYQTQLINDIPTASSITETCAQGCNRTTTMGYDSNGNIHSKLDYNGNLTTYNFDLSRDLESNRTEASGTAQARIIITQWHPTYRLPALITEPGRITAFQYDNSGNLLSKTVSANSSNRIWTYTYNTAGQVQTATNPRTDVTDTTTYGYDTSGNLASITNALNQVTTFKNYDGNGRVGLITDPNGATTALTYTPRGWLASKVITAGNVVQTTTYGYDNVGQLLLVTLPDNSTISYTYDTAHRLTNIKDSLGDSINYTLDLMSNRKAETVTDPNGVLTKQITRVFDAVNRVTQVTGAAQ